MFRGNVWGFTYIPVTVKEREEENMCVRVCVCGWMVEGGGLLHSRQARCTNGLHHSETQRTCGAPSLARRSTLTSLTASSSRIPHAIPLTTAAYFTSLTATTTTTNNHLLHHHHHRETDRG